MAQTLATISRPAYQAYQILHIGFIAAPALAGLDKFTHFLTNWDQYLAPAVERLLPVSGHTFMLLVGIVEMAAAVPVAARPRIGAYVVAAWLLGITLNLLLIPGYLDVALRDFGLALGALALADSVRSLWRDRSEPDARRQSARQRATSCSSLMERRIENLMNPLLALNQRDQFVWLDHISRSLITGGVLQRLIKEDGLGGVTSNPTIFDKAIAGSTDYDAGLHRALDAERNISNRALVERLIVEDIQMAADVLRPVYDRSDGANGFVSLEVSPASAHDTAATVAEARHLWHVVARPNVMIKVPATQEGIPAIEALTADGINVNITLMFSLEHYEAVAQAYLRGIHRYPNPHRVTSVASVFVSRLDVVADRLLEEIGSPAALSLRGKNCHRKCQTHLPAVP